MRGTTQRVVVVVDHEVVFVIADLAAYLSARMQTANVP